MARRDSAPGLDGMEYKMLRLLSKSGRICMLELFNTIWSTGVLPEDWLLYQVVFIDKVGREKVRPISLSSCVGKLMERMMNERLIWWAEREEKFSRSQSGFRRGRSCADNLTRITSDIRASISSNEYTLTAFLDVSSAYDCVDYWIMMDRLKALNCPIGIIIFIKRIYGQAPQYRVQGVDVYNSGEAKFLGIWLDSGLTFHRQVQEVRGKVNRANSILKYLCRVSSGMETNTALMLYKSLVRSVTDYGNFIYFSRDAAFQLKLERAQYMGIRTALGYRNSTPNNVIVAEAKVRSLRDRAFMLGSNFVNKTIVYNQNGLCQKLQHIISEHGLESPEIVFTDGSYDENKRSTAASLVICDQDEAYKISLPYLCSSFTAEAFAVKSALQLTSTQSEHRKRDIVVLSDCKSVLQGICNNHLNVHKNSYVTEARRLLYDLTHLLDKRVVLVWIPAHVGILGNELADSLAREAACEEADPSIAVPVGGRIVRRWAAGAKNLRRRRSCSGGGRYGWR
ncbi:uncharacterized protein [Temnothorax nylanderi]|uniref:uncharacterized protein n=1 Tax=Temnothorax nylanderi TaxID=102681 RepID=UPI003A899CA5